MEQKSARPASRRGAAARRSREKRASGRGGPSPRAAPPGASRGVGGQRGPASCSLEAPRHPHRSAKYAGSLVPLGTPINPGTRPVRHPACEKKISSHRLQNGHSLSPGTPNRTATFLVREKGGERGNCELTSRRRDHRWPQHRANGPTERLKPSHSKPVGTPPQPRAVHVERTPLPAESLAGGLSRVPVACCGWVSSVPGRVRLLAAVPRGWGRRVISSLPDSPAALLPGTNGPPGGRAPGRVRDPVARCLAVFSAPVAGCLAASAKIAHWLRCAQTHDYPPHEHGEGRFGRAAGQASRASGGEGRPRACQRRPVGAVTKAALPPEAREADQQLFQNDPPHAHGEGRLRAGHEAASHRETWLTQPGTPQRGHNGSQAPRNGGAHPARHPQPSGPLVPGGAQRGSREQLITRRPHPPEPQQGGERAQGTLETQPQQATGTRLSHREAPRREGGACHVDGRGWAGCPRLAVAGFQAFRGAVCSMRRPRAGPAAERSVRNSPAALLLANGPLG